MLVGEWKEVLWNLSISYFSTLLPPKQSNHYKHFFLKQGCDNMAVKEISTKEELLKGIEGIAMVGFYSPECERCRELAPLFMEMAEKYESKGVKFMRVNILNEGNRWAIETFSLHGPTLVIFKNKEPIVKLEAEKYPKEYIVEKVKEFFLKEFKE